MKSPFLLGAVDGGEFEMQQLTLGLNYVPYC